MTVRTIHLPAAASCGECGFTTADIHLLANHSCTIQEFGGTCEDFPCCGHEAGDCNGQKYGSDEEIKERYLARLNDPDYDEYYDEEW